MEDNLLYEVFKTTLNQMSVLFIFIIIGYIFKKRSLYPEELSTVLSRLIVHVFMPALVFNTFSSNLTPEVFSEKLPYFTVGLLLMAGSFLFAFLVRRLFSDDKYERGVYLYGFTIPNLGYLGYPIVGAVFGEQALFHMMILGLPFNLFIYTAGMYLLNPKREMSFKKLLNPTIIAIALGAAAGLTGVKMPQVVTGVCGLASACMAPTAMILSGFVLARTPPKKALTDPKMYLASATRLIVIPALAFIGLKIAGASADITLIGVALTAMPFGLNSVVFPEAFGGDSTVGAKSCFVSNILGLVTIPLVFMILTRFM